MHPAPSRLFRSWTSAGVVTALPVIAPGCAAPPPSLPPPLASGSGCAVDRDCPPAASPCAQARCLSGRCRQEPKPGGAPLPDEQRGDCKKLVCGPSGQVEAQEDPKDVPVEARACFKTRCEPGGPVSQPTPGATCEKQGVCSRDGECLEVVSIAAQAHHACALMAGGDVLCWGVNRQGQILGDDAEAILGRPARVSFVREATAVAVNETQSCALFADGAVGCWGGRGRSAARRRAGEPSFAPVQGLTGATWIGAAGYQACAIHGERLLACWDDATPRAVPIGRFRRQPKQVSVGPNAVCAALEDGAVQCFAARFPEHRYFPPPMGGVDRLRDVEQVAVGTWHACARHRDGAVSCWGINWNGEIAAGVRLSIEGAAPYPPTRVSGVAGAEAIFAGARHSCVLRDGGQLVCWGFPYPGMNSASAQPVQGFESVRSAALGVDFLCAILQDGRAVCAGDESGRPMSGEGAGAHAILF